MIFFFIEFSATKAAAASLEKKKADEQSTVQ
jgi:hypothetical protein